MFVPRNSPWFPEVGTEWRLQEVWRMGTGGKVCEHMHWTSHYTVTVIEVRVRDYKGQYFLVAVSSDGWELTPDCFRNAFGELSYMLRPAANRAHDEDEYISVDLEVIV